eukprot:gene37442-45470_t
MFSAASTLFLRRSGLGIAYSRQNVRCLNNVQKKINDEVMANNTVLYTWGVGSQGQLGHAKFEMAKSWLGEEYEQDTPRKVLRSKNVLSLALADHLTLALTKQGQLLGCGAHELLQIGGGAGVKQLNELTPLVADKHIVQVAVGSRHALLVDRDSRVFSWGFGGDFLRGGGQLGHGDRQACAEPRQISFLQDYGAQIREVSCGHAHSVFLTEEGAVLSCGAGEYGRLGTGSTQDAHLPLPLDALAEHDVAQVSAGHDHTLALTAEGRVFAWGRNQSGQLGQRDSYLDMYSMEDLPREIDVRPSASTSSSSSSSAVRFAYVSAGHGRSLAVSAQGELYVWGARLSPHPLLVEP